MAYSIREYTGYDEREILPLYESVGCGAFPRYHVPGREYG